MAERVLRRVRGRVREKGKCGFCGPEISNRHQLPIHVRIESLVRARFMRVARTSTLHARRSYGSALHVCGIPPACLAEETDAGAPTRLGVELPESKSMDARGLRKLRGGCGEDRDAAEARPHVCA